MEENNKPVVLTEHKAIRLIKERATREHRSDRNALARTVLELLDDTCGKACQYIELKALRDIKQEYRKHLATIREHINHMQAVDRAVKGLLAKLEAATSGGSRWQGRSSTKSIRSDPGRGAA